MNNHAATLRAPAKVCPTRFRHFVEALPPAVPTRVAPELPRVPET